MPFSLISGFIASTASAMGNTMAALGGTQDHSQPSKGGADGSAGDNQPSESVVPRERNNHGHRSRSSRSQPSRSGASTHIQHEKEQSSTIQTHCRCKGSDESSRGPGAPQPGTPRDSELDAVRRELEAIKVEMGKRADDFNHQAHKWKGEIEKLGREHGELEAMVGTAEQRAESLDRYVRRLQGENKALEYEREKQQEADRQLRQLLDARTKELRDAQSLLAKPDAISEADAVKMVHELNDEILQAAAVIAEVLVDKREGSHGVGEPPGLRHHSELRHHQERLAGVVRDPMVHALGNLQVGDPDVDASTLVQIALQAVMATLCMRVIQSWNGSGSYSDILEYTSWRMQAEENQMVYANWRALTLKHASREDYTHTTTPMVCGILDLSIVAGLWAGDPRQFESIVSDRFNQKLLGILKQTHRIRQAVGQSITSVNLHVWVASPPVNYNAREMDDAYGEAGRPVAADDSVAASTGLGIFRTASRPGESQKMLVKPQVVLGSTIWELLASDETEKKR